MIKSTFLFSLLIVFFSLNVFSNTKSTLANIKVGAYNVQNLFDLEHDEGKNDFEFLPKGHPEKESGCKGSKSCLDTNWDQIALTKKITNIKSVFSLKDLPDIMGIEEVENLKVLKKLAYALGYKYSILEEGPDKRGIDCGLLYNTDNLIYLDHAALKLKGPEFDDKPTRDILAVYFQVKNIFKPHVLAVYVNHWPSQAAPGSKRTEAARQLKDYIEADKAKFSNISYNAILLGDFNTTDSDYPHPFRTVLQNSDWSNHFADVREKAKEEKVYDSKLPIGTYFYPESLSWQILDRFFVSQNLLDGNELDVDLNTFKIVNNAQNKSEYLYENKNSSLFGSIIKNVPFRFNVDKIDDNPGVSDHFPITVELSWKIKK